MILIYISTSSKKKSINRTKIPLTEPLLILFSIDTNKIPII